MSCPCRRVRPPVASGQATKNGNVSEFFKAFRNISKINPHSEFLSSGSEPIPSQAAGSTSRERERERDQGKKENTKTLLEVY